MFNKCALNAFFVRPGRMRRVKCDNRNEEKGHFPGTALGIDVITAAYHLVWAVLGSTVGHGAEVKGDMLQFTDDVTEGGQKEQNHANSTSFPFLYKIHLSCLLLGIFIKTQKTRALYEEALKLELEEEARSRVARVLQLSNKLSLKSSLFFFCLVFFLHNLLDSQIVSL